MQCVLLPINKWLFHPVDRINAGNSHPCKTAEGYLLFMRQSDSLVGGFHRLLGSVQVTVLACCLSVTAAAWKHIPDTKHHA